MYIQRVIELPTNEKANKWFLILKFNWFLLLLWFYVVFFKEIISSLKIRIWNGVCTVVSSCFYLSFDAMGCCVCSEIRNPLHYARVYFYVAVVLSHWTRNKMKKKHIQTHTVGERVRGRLSVARDWCYFSSLIWVRCRYKAIHF